eukprot:4348618-Pleurochrysis_carterae.AAC.1
MGCEHLQDARIPPKHLLSSPEDVWVESEAPSASSLSHAPCRRPSHSAFFLDIPGSVLGSQVSLSSFALFPSPPPLNPPRIPPRSLCSPLPLRLSNSQSSRPSPDPPPPSPPTVSLASNVGAQSAALAAAWAWPWTRLPRATPGRARIAAQAQAGRPPGSRCA